MKMEPKRKNRLLFLLFAALMGFLVGGILWGFLKAMTLGIAVLWEILPARLSLPWYPLCVCTCGGLIIGLYQRAVGPYPESLQTVLGTVKKTGSYPSDKLPLLLAAALLPLVFGGSLGPEAGLTGVVVGLCCWVGGRLSYAHSHLRELTQIGVSATLGVLFRAPLFGLLAPIEESTDSDRDTVWPKSSKLMSYLLSILGAMAAFWLLGSLFGGTSGLPRLTGEELSNRERLLGIPLALLGGLFGYLYVLAEHAARRVFGALQRKTGIVLSAVLGGVILGLIGMMLPLSLFSGEEQMNELTAHYAQMTPWMLIGLGCVKMVLTNVCLQSGWRGGEFFPMIFSGVSIGYGVALLLGSDPVFTVAVITAALLGVVMRKPVAVSMLLLLCFPARVVPWMLLAACVGSYLPLPGQGEGQTAQP